MPPHLLWHGAAPWLPSGYGQQTRLVAEALVQLGATVTISAHSYSGPVTEWHGATVLPAGGSLIGRAALASNLAEATTRRGEVDAVVVHADAWLMCDEPDLPLERIWWWLPIDGAPLPAPFERLLRRGGRPVAISRFGAESLTEAGFVATAIPHALDPRFVPSTEARAANKAKVGFPDDCHVFGLVADNHGDNALRKNVPETLDAIARLRSRRHPSDRDICVYLHGDPSGRSSDGIDLRALISRLGLPDGTVIGLPPFQARAGVSTDQLCDLYRAMDTLVAVSGGEGFGLPVVEAQACGTPVVVSAYSAQPELVLDGWSVPGHRRWRPLAESWFVTPDPGLLDTALEAAYEHSSTSGAAATPAVTTASLLHQWFAPERVARCWLDLISSEQISPPWWGPEQ